MASAMLSRLTAAESCPLKSATFCCGTSQIAAPTASQSALMRSYLEPMPKSPTAHLKASFPVVRHPSLRLHAGPAGWHEASARISISLTVNGLQQPRHCLQDIDHVDHRGQRTHLGVFPIGANAPRCEDMPRKRNLCHCSLSVSSI